MKKIVLRSVAYALLLAVTDFTLSASLRTGLDRYYGFGRPVKVLCIGNSHLDVGVDSTILERRLGVPVAKFAVSGTNVFDHLVMMRAALRELKPDVVVYGASRYLFTGRGRGVNQYRLLYPYMDNPHIDAHVARNTGSWSEYSSRKVVRTLRYNDADTLNLALRSLLGRPLVYSGVVDSVALQARMAAGAPEYRARVDAENVEAFRTLVKEVSASGARLIVAYMPVVDILRNHDAAAEVKVAAALAGAAGAEAGVVNLAPSLENRHDLFYDGTHLNRHGQKILTEALASAVRPALEATWLHRQ